MAKLGEVCKVSPSTKNIERQGAWLLNLDMVEQQTGRVIEYKYVGEDDLNGSIIQFDTENVLYSKLRPNLNKVVLPQKDGFSTSELLPLRPDASVLNKDYLAVFLRSDSFVTWAVSKTAGAKMPRLGTKDLMNAEIPVPSIEQQKKIAEKFKKLEQLISLRKQQLEKLDELVKARFVEKSKEWQAVPGQLNEFLEDITYGFTNPMPDAEEGPWKVTAKDVVNGHINILTARKTTNEAFERLTNKSKPRKGDVLLTKDGTLGRVAVVDVENLCVNQSVAVMRCNNKIYPEFLAMILQMPEYQRKLLEDSGGGTIKHLYITKVDKILISVPDLVIQKALLMFAKRVEQQKQTVQQSLEKLELMKKALMQEYFG